MRASTMSKEYHANTARQLDLFTERAPKKPYCTNSLHAGLRITNKISALKARYVQANGPTHRFWLPFDIDRPGGGIDWDDRGAPAPNIAVINKENGHAHLLYALEVPVRTAYDANRAPLRFAAAVEGALRCKLGADEGYSGLIVKNPLHSHWRVLTSARGTYDLSELAEYVDISQFSDRRRKLADYGLGRNCTLFEELRKWAYRAIRQGWPEYYQWETAVWTRAEGLNSRFRCPLPANEVKHVAKSIAKWTHKHFAPADFSEWQAVRGQRGGIAKGEAYADKAAEARRMRAEGLTTRAIAEALGVSQKSASNWTSTFLSK